MIISNLADWISIIAGSMTIIGLSGIITWGIGKHLSSGIANRVYNISLSVFKLGLVCLLMFIFFFLWKFTYEFMLLITKGSIVSDTFYWDDAHPMAHLVCYITTGSIFFFFAIMCSLCVIMGSITPFSVLPKKWRNKNIALDIEKKKGLEIIEAKYGSGTTFVDVKEHLKQYNSGDQIMFQLTNKIFGFDPTPKVPKILKLTVKSAGKEKQYEFKEKSIVQIKEDDIKP